MADLSHISNGIHGKIAMLLNNEKFSDVEILVKKDDGKYQKFCAHKLVLAVASETFGNMFYDTSIIKPQIKLNDIKPVTFSKFLKYLYTDRINFEAMSETNELYNLAKKYGVVELGEKCLQYILKDQITIENLFAKYDCALGENVKELLMVCRNFASYNTKTVLQTQNFFEATFPVVQDIIALDHLNIESELEVINAILKWGENECKQRGFPPEDCYIRNSISSLLKHLRFLTLTAEEFCDFVEEHNIFSGHECSILTRKILQPNKQVNIPDIFCHFTTKRLSYLNVSNSDTSKGNNIKYSDNYNMFKENDTELRGSSDPDINCNRSKKVNLLDFEETGGNLRESSVQSIDYIKRSKKMDSLDSTDEHNACFENPPLKSHPNVEKYFSALKKSAHNIADANYLFSSSNPSQNVKKTETVSPPVLKVQPCNFYHREFTFDTPLYPMQRGFKYSFDNDIKCIAHLKMIKGSMIVYGIELKIKNHAKVTDELEVFLSLSGFIDEAVNEVCEKKLKDNLIAITFPKPQKLLESKEACIEVTIESLRLDRCSICPEGRRKSELNCGLSTMSELFLTSNQTADEGIVFFISRIIYAPYAR